MNGLLLLAEYNVYQPSPLNEKVLKEKRKKLRETFDRVMRLYVSLFDFVAVSEYLIKQFPYVAAQRRSGPLGRIEAERNGL